MTTRELYCEGNDDAAQLLTATLNGRNRANVMNDEIRRMYAPNENAILLTHDDDFRRIHQHWINRPARLQLIPAHGGILLLPAFPIWGAERAATEIDAFLRHTASLTNECYEWTSDGWLRR